MVRVGHTEFRNRSKGIKLELGTEKVNKLGNENGMKGK